MNKKEGNFKVEAYDRRNLTVSYTHISALFINWHVLFNTQIRHFRWHSPNFERTGRVYIKRYLVPSPGSQSAFLLPSLHYPSMQPTKCTLYPLPPSVSVAPSLQFHLLVLLLEEECQNFLIFHSILYLHLDPTHKKRQSISTVSLYNVLAEGWHIQIQSCPWTSQLRFRELLLPPRVGLHTLINRTHLSSVLQRSL